jgi:hypothetical protein
MRLVRNLSFKGFQSCVLDREACCPPVPQLIDRALVSLSPVWFLDELEGLAYSRSQNSLEDRTTDDGRHSEPQRMRLGNASYR